MATLPSRQQIEQAGDLDFEQTRAEKPISIQIEVSPAGLTVKAAYQGTLSSIPAALAKLKAAGVLELVEQSRPAAAAPMSQVEKKPAERVEPLYKSDGTACCPVHKRELSEGQYGLFCSAKAKG